MTIKEWLALPEIQLWFQGDSKEVPIRIRTRLRGVLSDNKNMSLEYLYESKRPPCRNYGKISSRAFKDIARPYIEERANAYIEEERAAKASWTGPLFKVAFTIRQQGSSMVPQRGRELLHGLHGPIVWSNMEGVIWKYPSLPGIGHKFSKELINKITQNTTPKFREREYDYGVVEAVEWLPLAGGEILPVIAIILIEY